MPRSWANPPMRSVSLMVFITLLLVLCTAAITIPEDHADASPLVVTGSALPNGATAIAFAIDDSIAGTHSLSCRLLSPAQAQFDMTTTDQTPVLKVVGQGIPDVFVSGSFSREDSALQFALDLPSGVATTLTLQNTVIKLRPITGLPALGEKMEVVCDLGDASAKVKIEVPSPTTSTVPYTVIIKSQRLATENDMVSLSGVFDTTNAITDELKGFNLSIEASPETQIKWFIDSELGISVKVAGTKTFGTYDDEKGLVSFAEAVIPHTAGVEFEIVGISVQLIDPTKPAIEPHIQLTIPTLRAEPFKHVILPPGANGKATIITSAAVLEATGAVSFEGFLNTGTRSIPGTSFACTVSDVGNGIQFSVATGFTAPIVVIDGVNYDGAISPDGFTVSFTELAIPPSKSHIPFYFLNTAVIWTEGKPVPTVAIGSCTFADWSVTETFSIPSPKAHTVPPAAITLSTSRVDKAVKISGVVASEFGGFDRFSLSCKPTDPTQLRFRRPNNGLPPTIRVDPGFETTGAFNPHTESVEFPSVPLIGTGPTFNFDISNIFVTLQTGIESGTGQSVTCSIAEMKSAAVPRQITPPLTDVGMPLFTSVQDVKKRTTFQGSFNKNAFTDAESKFTIKMATAPTADSVRFDFSRSAGTYAAHLTTKKPLDVIGTVNKAKNELAFTIPKQAAPAEGDANIIMTFDARLFLILHKPTDEAEPPTSGSIIFTTTEWIDEYPLVLPETESAMDTFTVEFAATKSTDPIGYVIPSFKLPATPVVPEFDVNDEPEGKLHDVMITIEDSVIGDDAVKCYSFLIHDPDYQKDSSVPQPTQIVIMAINKIKYQCPLSDHKTIICPKSILSGSEAPIDITMDGTFLIRSGKDAKCNDRPKPRLGVSIEAFSDQTVSGQVDDIPVATGDWETKDWASQIVPSIESSLNAKEFVQFSLVVNGKNKTQDAAGVSFELVGSDFVFLVHNPQYDGKNTTLPPSDLYPTIQLGDDVKVNGTLSATKNVLTFSDLTLQHQNFNNTLLFTNVFILKSKPTPVGLTLPQHDTLSQDELVMYDALTAGDDVKIKVTVDSWGVQAVERSLQHVPTQDDDWAEKDPKGDGMSGAEIFLIICVVFFCISLLVFVVFKFILPSRNQRASARATGEKQALRPKEGELTTTTSDGEPQPKPKKKKSRR